MTKPKKHYGTIEMFLDYVPTKRSSVDKKEHPHSGGIEKLLSDQVQTLASILKNIGIDIGQRETLSKNLINHITENYLYLKAKLYQLAFSAFGGLNETHSRRSSIEQQLETLNQEFRAELHRRWLDISSLKAECRRWFKEYRNLLDRVRLILEK